ncbi:MAG TPA: putative quinol monooxygenase [Trebonia sp.]
MILINIKFQIRPDKVDQWLALADSYARDVNSEDGCLFFQFARSLTDDNEFICIEGFRDADAGGAHVKQPYVKKFFDTAPDLVATQPQIIYIDTPHDGFGPMGEIQPRPPADLYCFVPVRWPPHGERHNMAPAGRYSMKAVG